MLFLSVVALLNDIKVYYLLIKKFNGVQLITMILSLEKIILFAYVRNSDSLKTGGCFHYIALLFRKSINVTWRLHLPLHLTLLAKADFYSHLALIG